MVRMSKGKKSSQVVNRQDIIQIASRPVEIRWLVSHFGSEVPEQLAAFAGTYLVVGSNPDVDIVLPYPDISPFACRTDGGTEWKCINC